MRALALCAAFVALAGCEGASSVADEIARDQAKRAIDAAVATRLPGVDVSPVTNCVIDNSSAGEILAFATNAAAGAPEENVDLLVRVLQRPETQTCVVNASLTAFVL